MSISILAGPDHIKENCGPRERQGWREQEVDEACSGVKKCR